MADEAAIAHLLRRTTFGPFPTQVATLAAAGDHAAAVESIITATPPALPAAPPLDGSSPQPPEWWMTRMADPAVGLHERMTWFWHGHLTSSQDKVGSWQMMWNQHQLLRQHTLGNFRTLLQAITIDAAMLVYLDGDPSDFREPNENYSREVMELFALGIGNYTETDVRNGAIALAGWDVDYDTATPTFSPSHANPTSNLLPFLGTTVARYADVINAVCASPACAPWVVGRIHRFFFGLDPSPARRTELANIFTTNNLEIRPVVEAVLRDPALFDPAIMGINSKRARTPVEWATAAFAVIGSTDRGRATRTADDMGQIPFYPPSVAGWPGGTRFLAAADALERADIGDSGVVAAPEVVAAPNATAAVDAALLRASLYEVSTPTRNALITAANGVANTTQRAQLLLGLIICTPEFALS